MLFSWIRWSKSLWTRHRERQLCPANDTNDGDTVQEKTTPLDTMRGEVMESNKF
jgi:hypothetical protein